MSIKEIKGNLARLLATENLIVEHKQTPTAYFNVDSRVLTLPKWDKASDTVYDMLVGHEVGHALFTPNVDFREHVSCPQDYVNVIEDARIEKLMKRKYPGLKKSFTGGYSELNDKDFFQILDTDLTKLSLIDRINLHFKLGAYAMIPLSGAELVFAARADMAETFDEVCKIAEDVYNFSKEQEDDMEETEVSISQPESATGGDMEDDGEGFGMVETKAPKTENAPSTEGSTGGTSGAELEDVRDDWYDDDGNLIDDDDIGGDIEDEGGIEGSQTQKAFDGAAEKLSSTDYSRVSEYIEIPENVDTSEHIVDWKVLHDWIDSQTDERDDYSEIDDMYKTFRKQSQKEVNYLVKEFECRKSADAYARAGTAKTGVLNTGLLHTYKYNEDLFKRVTVVPDGKNHGMIFILDWSGSMCYELLATVKQLINLTSFCKKVQIPFEVYAFTNEWRAAQNAIENGIPSENLSYHRSYYGDEDYDKMVKGQFNIDSWFHLMNFVSSRSNGKDYERMVKNLFRQAAYHGRYGSYNMTSTIGLGLSGTPLNESIVLLNYMVPEFKKQNDLQKVNVCILTDGEACGSSYGYEYDRGEGEVVIRARRIDVGVALRDRKTGHTYTGFEYGRCTNIFIRQLRDRNPDVSVLGFRILSGGQLMNFVDTYGAEDSNFTEIKKQWKKEKSAIIKNGKAYTALYAINNKALDADTEFVVKDNAKKGDITRAFKKMLSNKAVNKKLLNSFVSHVS